MSRNWTQAEIQTASEAMREAGQLSYEEFCKELNRRDRQSGKEEQVMGYEILKDDAWESITEEELHDFHEECIEADINTPEYQKTEYEQESGNVWEDTPDDFEEFKAQMIADGMLRIKK